MIALLGPTASGKTSLALELAEACSGEIISCDSMAVYRGLDIGTAKPTADDQARVPHHCIDCVDIDESYDVHHFVREAQAAWEAIERRGRLPILCGGTGLYARALLYRFAFRPSDPAIQAQVREGYEQHGTGVLIQELDSASPGLAARVGQNPRRLQRAVEVLRITGRPPEPQPPPAPLPDVSQVILIPNRALSAARIARRVDMMLESGWVEETEHLLRAGLREAPTARQALGYPLIMDFLDGKLESKDELRERLVIATRQYAKRQRTWFRKQHPGANLVELDAAYPLSDLQALLRSISARLRR